MYSTFQYQPNLLCGQAQHHLLPPQHHAPAPPPITPEMINAAYTQVQEAHKAAQSNPDAFLDYYMKATEASKKMLELAQQQQQQALAGPAQPPPPLPHQPSSSTL